MKKLVCGLLASMLLSGTAAALEPISQPIATSGYTYYAIRADGALLAWGDSFHGAVGPADQDPLYWEDANILLENARYVAAGFVMAAAIDTDGVLWGWGGHAGRTFGEEEPYRLLENVAEVSIGDTSLYGAAHRRHCVDLGCPVRGVFEKAPGRSLFPAGTGFGPCGPAGGGYGGPGGRDAGPIRVRRGYADGQDPDEAGGGCADLERF